MKIKNLVLFLVIIIFISCSESSDDESSSTTDSVTYSVEISAASGGTVDNSGGSFDSGSTLTVTATPNSGYAFINWSDGTTDNPKELNVNSNLTLTANFGEAFTVSTEFAELYNSIDGLSTVGDNQILKSGVESVRELDLSDPTGGSTIGFLDDLSGIENFTNLRKLTVDRQSLRRVDLSKNTKLEYVWIANNKLIEINLKNLEFLEELQLIGNQLETIDLSDSPYLKILRLGENYFSSFDLESTPRVNYLVLKSNPLTEIKNLEDLTLLKSLFIGNTSLSSLDVSQLPLLEFVEAPNTNLLNCIQVSQNQLDNFVSTWTYDEGQGFSTSCN
jgi:hypothetical protein